MSGHELDTHTARLVRLTDKGLNLNAAERMADKLVMRDREGDDRRLCLECAHLQGMGRWRCGNALAADLATDALAHALVTMLQRCTGFAAWPGAPEQPTPAADAQPAPAIGSLHQQSMRVDSSRPVSVVCPFIR